MTTSIVSQTAVQAERRALRLSGLTRPQAEVLRELKAMGFDGCIDPHDAFPGRDSTDKARRRALQSLVTSDLAVNALHPRADVQLFATAWEAYNTFYIALMDHSEAWDQWNEEGRGWGYD